MKKLFLFDVDGTLVDTITHKVPQSTINSIRKLQEKGHIVGISTGRSIDSLKEGNFHKMIPWDIFLCNNGQAIYDCNLKQIHLACIPEEAVHAAIQIAHESGSPMLLIGEKHILTKEANDYVFESHAFFHLGIPPVEQYDGFPVVMMIAYGPQNHDYHEYAQIPGIKPIPGLSTYADVILDGYSKYKGIEIVLKHLQLNSYIAFGDSMNDYEMIKHATLGIAMGNGHNHLKNIALYTTKSVSEHGIEYALKHFGFIE